MSDSLNEILENLNNALSAKIPGQKDDNILIATWNLKEFGIKCPRNSKTSIE